MLGKKVVSQSLIYGLASLLINGSNFFLIPLYTHYLTASEYGIISSVTVFSTFTTAALTLGLNGAITRFYFQYQEDDFRRFLFSVFLFQILTGLVITVIIMLSRGWFLGSIFNNVPYEPYLKYGILIGFTGIFSSIPLAFLQAQSKALQYRIFTSVSFLVLTALMILFVVVFRDGSLGGVRAQVIANSLMALSYIVFLIRAGRLNFEFDFVKVALYFSIPLMVYAIFGTLTELSSKYFIEKFISLSELGIYNAAQQFSAIITLVVNAINMAWTPLFYSIAKENETSELFSEFGKLLIFMLTSMGLALSLFAEQIVAILMSADYQEVSRYMPVLILAYIIGNGYWVLIINPLSFSKKTIYLPMLTILSGIISIGLNLLLVPRIGAWGAAWATCFTYFVLITTAYLPFRKFSAVRYDFASMNKMVAIAVILYIVSSTFSIKSLIGNVAFKACILLVFYFIVSHFRIYSIRDVKSFLQSQFNPRQ